MYLTVVHGAAPHRWSPAWRWRDTPDRSVEVRRLALENRLLENRVLPERIAIARFLGASDSAPAPLLNELVPRRVRAWNGAQDEGFIESATATSGQNRKSK
ncbi:MAG: hypothetical protein KatS3mg077_2250 [Candidatus Binatia bacterium]|nr:MAG: hypothetical protein KatS3mg077_2250 [Candidatus Binatia bacterium]